MASIKDAFEESFYDHHAIIKYIIFAIPVFYCTNLYTNQNDLNTFWVLAFILYVLLFGFMLECTANVQKGTDHILPSFNIFKIFWAGLKGSIALGPSIIINSCLSVFCCNVIKNYISDPNTLTIFNFVIWGLFSSIILTGYLCYTKNYKISDAYNLKIISDSCADILIAVIFMIPQIILVDAIIIAPVTYIIWLFFGIPHPIATFYWCTVGILNIAMIGHYLAQISYENITIKENKNKII